MLAELSWSLVERIRRTLLLLTLLLLLLVAVSCGGDDDGADGVPTPTAGGLTLTDDGCVHEGPDEIAEGNLSMTLVNDTRDAASFDVWKIDEGSSFEDFAAHISRQQARAERGRPTLGPPPFANMISSAPVPSSGSVGLAATVDIGLYGFVCSRLEESDRLVAVFSAGPLQVIEGTGAEATST